MSISETTLAGNHGTTSAGSTPPGISAARASQEICNIAEQIKAHVTKAAQKGDSFDEAERAAWNSVLQIGFQAMQLFVALQGQGDLGEQLQPENGRPLIRSKTPVPTIVRSVFGEHTFEQFTYSAGNREVKRNCWSRRPIARAFR